MSANPHLPRGFTSQKDVSLSASCRIQQCTVYPDIFLPRFVTLLFELLSMVLEVLAKKPPRPPLSGICTREDP